MSSIRPLNDWLLIQMDPLPTMSGSIILPGGATRIRTGTVVRVGPGKWAKEGGERIPVEVQDGDRVAFFRENLEHQNGKQVTHTLEEFGRDLALLRVADVLYVMDEERKSMS